MRNLSYYLFILLWVIQCNTIQKNTITKSQTNIDKATSKEEIDRIILNVYNKKDSVRENQKDEFVDFFIKNIEESDMAKTSLIRLYNDPNFNDQKPKIWDHLISYTENEEVWDFVQKEVIKNPQLYNLKLKQELLQNQNPLSARLLLDLLYLGKEKLDPELIHLFRKTQFEDSLPILIQSIEEQKFVEECMVAIASIRNEDAETYLVNTATDYQNPHRKLALSHIGEINNKELAYSIYVDVLKNTKLQDEETLYITLNSLKTMVSYLNPNQVKELKNIINNLPPRYKNISQEVLELLHLKENNLLSDNYKLEPKTEEKRIISNPTRSDKIPKPIAMNVIKEETQNQNLHKKANQEKPKQRKNLPLYSQNYANKISSNLKKLFPENSNEVQKKIHNALLTYSKSHSDRAKFIQSAYKNYYNIQEEPKIKELLKEGIYINESLYAILKYIKEQYKRKDLQVFAFQELFLVKRAESKMILENSHLFK